MQIEDRLDKVECLLQQVVEKGLLAEFQRPLRGLPNIEAVLSKLGRPNYKAFLDLAAVNLSARSEAIFVINGAKNSFYAMRHRFCD